MLRCLPTALERPKTFCPKPISFFKNLYFLQRGEGEDEAKGGGGGGHKSRIKEQGWGVFGGDEW